MGEKKKQTNVCGDKHKEIYNKLCISGKKKSLNLDISYVPTYIFRRNKLLNNNRNSKWDGN